MPTDRPTDAGGITVARDDLTPAVEAKWDRRLENWGLWYAGHSHGTASSSAYERLENQDTRPREGAQTYTPRDPPALVGEALDTDMLVSMLIEDQRKALKVWYAWSGSLEFRAEQLGCHVNTLRNRRGAAIVDLERLDGPVGPRKARPVQPVVVRRTQGVPDEYPD